MALRCGVDLVEVGRIAEAINQHGDAFRRHIYTPGEVEYCESRGVSRFQSYAARFAAKEAVAKALGTGLANGVSWSEIEVVMEDGRPGLRFHGGTRAVAERLGLVEAAISLSHSDTQAIAMVILELRAKG